MRIYFVPLKKKNAVYGTHYIWSMRNLPVVLDSWLEQSTINNVNAGIKQSKVKTWLRFYNRGNESSYVKYYDSPTGTCYAPIGNGGIYWPMEDKITIGSKCYGIGIELHEPLHTLGFTHEFQRPDRDNYLTSEASTAAKQLAWHFQTFGAPYNNNFAINYYAFIADVKVRNDPYGH